MRGRYRLTRSDKQLNESFDADGDFDIVPRYNIAPFPTCSNDPPRVPYASPTFDDAMGTCAFLGKGCEHRVQNNQCPGRDGADYPILPRTI